MAFDNYKNFVRVTVAQGYDAAATAVALVPGDVARLPAIPFNLTWWNSTDYGDPSLDPNVEIVRVTTAPVGNTLTVARAQQSTTATDKNTAAKTYEMIAGVDLAFITELKAQLTALGATDTGIDTRLDALEATDITHNTAITNLQSADVALDTRVDALEAGGGGGSVPDGDIYIAEDHGISVGAADNTAALQTIINTIATNQRNATIVFSEEGPYIFAGAVADTSASNCIIKFPTVAIDERQYSITLKGGAGRVMFSPSAYSATPLQAGTRIKCTTNTGSGARPSFMSGLGPSGPSNNITYVCVRFEDLILQMPANPVLTCLNLNKFTNTSFKDCVVQAGNSQYIGDLTEPTTAASFGVIQPDVSSGINQRVEGVLNVMGFYNGLRVGEGAMINDVGIWACKNGLTYDMSHGNSRIFRVIFGWCPTGIQINAQHPIIIDEMDTERWTAAAWYQFVRDVNDPANVGRGELRYRTVIASVGWSPGTFTMNGGINLYVREMGTSPVVPPGTTPTFVMAEIGMINSSTVDVQFSEIVKAPDFTAGASVKVNGTPRAITSATRQADKAHVYYVLASGVISGDIITFSYEAADGFVESEAGAPLADIVNQSVINSGGSAPILFDSFTDSDGVTIPAHTMDVGPGWTRFEGAGATQATIQGNKAVMPVDGGSAYAYTTTGAANGTITATFTYGDAANNHNQLIFRYLDPLNFWSLRAFGGFLSLQKWVAGSDNVMQTSAVSITTGVSYEFKVILNGTSIQVTAFGVTLSTGPDPFNATETKSGFRSYCPTTANTVENYMMTTATS